MRIDDFNQLPDETVACCLRDCCAAQQWVTLMVAARPFNNVDNVLSLAAASWSRMSEKDCLEAFDAHPKIGDPASLKKKFASTHALAAHEQHSVAQADKQTIEELAGLNADYARKFGFIFIVCASGKSADEMLLLIRTRLPNDRNTELTNAAREQAAITAIRIRKLFGRQ